MKRRSYSMKFKIDIIDKISQFGVSRANEEYKIPRRSLRGWIKNKEKLNQESEYHKHNRTLTHFYKLQKLHPGRHTVLTKEQEGLIYSKFLNKREGNEIVYNRDIIEWALDFNIPKFQASYSWLKGFKRRHGIVLRKASNNCRLSDDEIVAKKHEIHDTIRETISNSGNTKFANMDETRIQFEAKPQRTNAIKGSKTVKMRRSKNYHKACTAILACTDDGKMLTATLLFAEKKKGEFGPRVLKSLSIPDNLKIRASKSGWVTKTVMKEWLEDTWLNEGEDYNLICDNFSSHKATEIKEFVKDNSINLSYLPSNTTPLFQPLDVGINKIFKERVYKIINAEENRDKKNYRQVIIDAVSLVLSTIDPEIVKKSFTMAGFDEFKKPSENKKDSASKKKGGQKKVKMPIFMIFRWRYT